MTGQKTINLESEEVLKLLREIKNAPEVTQRELSASLGVSLGKINFLMNALIQKGYVKARNFRNSNNKVGYVYLLTPWGLEEKARITYHFLMRKTQEYDSLKREIEKLRKEVRAIENLTLGLQAERDE